MDSAVNEIKLCLICGARLRGRIDKKFCNDYCRNNYNNRIKLRDGQGRLIRNINNVLMRNRKILESFLSGERSRASREKMLELGFQFKYMTHTFQTRAGRMYYFCYDYGYLPLEKDGYLIVRDKIL